MIEEGLSKPVYVSFVDFKKDTIVYWQVMLDKDVKSLIKLNTPIQLGKKVKYIIQDKKLYGECAIVSIIPMEDYKSCEFRVDEYIPMEEYRVDEASQLDQLLSEDKDAEEDDFDYAYHRDDLAGILKLTTANNILLLNYLIHNRILQDKEEYTDPEIALMEDFLAKLKNKGLFFTKLNAKNNEKFSGKN